MNKKNPENKSEEECDMAEQRASGTTEHQMTRAGSDELGEAQAQRAGINFEWHFGRVTSLGVYEIANSRTVTILWEEGGVSNQQGDLTDEQWEKEMISRRTVLFAGACLCAVGERATAQARTRVRLGGITYTAADAAGPYAALKQSYFQEEGIDPVLSTHANGPLVLQKMTAGDVDVAISTAISPFFQAVASGVDLIWIASSTKGNSGLVVHPSIKSIRDLDGKRIGVAGLGTSQDALLSNLEQKNGIKIKHVYGPVNNLVGFMQKGEIEGFTSWHPALEIARRQVGAVYLMKAMLPGAESLGIMVPRAFAQKNPTIVVGLLRAHLRGIRYFQQNRDEYVRWVAEREGIDADVVRAVVFDKDAIDAEHPVTDREGALILVRASRDAGFISKELVPSDTALTEWMGKHIDESYLQTAMKELSWTQ
jgi:NitT/TauT family transport system substrate-binding protein